MDLFLHKEWVLQGRFARNSSIGIVLQELRQQVRSG